MSEVTLWQGDCLVEMARIADGSVDCIITDLPYGLTNCAWDSVIPFSLLWAAYKRIIKRNGAIVLFGSQPFTSALVMSNPAWFRYEWIWEKSLAHGYMNANKQLLRNHESALVFYDSQPTYNPQFTKGKPYRATSGSSISHVGDDHLTGCKTVNDGRRFPLSVIKFNHEAEKMHPTQKPSAILRYLVLTYTNEGETVLDSTMGSGTCGVACVQTKRNFIGIEKDEGYFKIATERICTAQAQGILDF